MAIATRKRIITEEELMSLGSDTRVEVVDGLSCRDVFVIAFELNYVNLGFFSPRLVLIEAISLLVELPLALATGAQVYESGRWANA